MADENEPMHICIGFLAAIFFDLLHVDHINGNLKGMFTYASMRFSLVF